MRALAVLSIFVSVFAAAAPARAVESGLQGVQRLASVIADAPLDSADRARLDAAWRAAAAKGPNAAQRGRDLDALGTRLTAEKLPYKRAHNRDLLAGVAHCPLPKADPEHALQAAIGAVAARHAPVVARFCGAKASYVVTEADVAALLAEQRFFAAQTGLEVKAWNDGRPLSAWAAEIRTAFPTAPVLLQERLAHAESRWVLTKLVWDQCSPAQRAQIVSYLKARAKGRNLGAAVIDLHAELILGGTLAGLRGQMGEFLAAAGLAMQGQAVLDTSMREIRSWGN